jgi:glycosyltransferase 2 family protein
VNKVLLRTLKVAVPLALGVWLVIYFYRQLDPPQRTAMVDAFRQADKRWLWGTLILSWLSHAIRAYRWRFLLSHIGYHPGFWNSYHAVMIGYFMNLLLPRAGEASRAVTLYRTDKVPFERGFGTILAERAVDFLMLLSTAAITLLLQFDKLDLFQARIAAFQEHQGTGDGGHWSRWVLLAAVIIITAGGYLIVKRPQWHVRMMDGLRGFSEGLRAVIHTKHKGPFILHTFVIWFFYLAMFWAGFFCLSSTTRLPAAGVFAGFIAGSVGIVLVQGGIGAYPACVATIVSIYMTAPAGGGLIHPDALAMGWLLWAAQTVLIIMFGGLSLLLVARNQSRALKRPT